MTAKYWGKGPKQWTPGLVSALTLREFDMAPSPSAISAASPSGTHVRHRLTGQNPENPTQLCKWVIHVPEVGYEAIEEPQDEVEPVFDAQNPSSWPVWQQEMPISLVDSMENSLAQSSFSATPTTNLPISTESITQSVQQTPKALETDALRMAIMAGNADSVANVLDAAFRRQSEDDSRSIYPFHLAAAFLDGGNTCCGTLRELVRPRYNLPQRDNVNDLGHTILDSFMISILRSHTSLGPEHVSTDFKPPHRYPGEEKDICGRWDADSPTVQSLFRHGYSRVPTQWKHPFCHSAVQAVCHGLITLFAPGNGPEINSPSGLFTRRCKCCGLELKLGPFHTLVVVAFYLAQLGMAGETLFGPLAVLVCLLRLRGRVSIKAKVSVKGILGAADSELCDHDPIDAIDLLQAVPEGVVAQWSSACQVGWRCILEVLLEARRWEHQTSLGEDASPSPEPEEDLMSCPIDLTSCPIDLQFDKDFHSEDGLNLPAGCPISSLLWATIQTELLTYRRVQQTDRWISDRFSMEALCAWLTGDTETFETALVQEGLMEWKTHEGPCCGWFDYGEVFLPVASEVCTKHFMNMDVYGRASFIHRLDIFDWG